jgi:hypothetical protein
MQIIIVSTEHKDGISEYLALGDRYDTRSKERSLGTVSKVSNVPVLI